MIYLILSEDPIFIDQGLCLRISVEGKVKSFYVVRYADNREEAENYCKFGGFISGTRIPRFIFKELKKIGEK